jgi:PAS domain S-box-containing protein
MDQSVFKALFEHSSLGIIISSDQGIIEKSNPFAAKIFGYEVNELNGQVVEILLPRHLREVHVLYRQKYTSNPHPRAMGSNLNLSAVKKSGEEFPVEVSLTFFETDGRKQIVSFINDITERKQAEDRLKRLTEELESKVKERTKDLSDALLELSHANVGLQDEMEQRKRIEAQIREMLEREKELSELKSRFVSMASHEFRTPLAGILTSASLISKYNKSEDDPKRQKHVLSIKKSVKNLTGILNDFLSLDKLEQGKIATNPTRFDFVHFIDELIADFRETSDREFIFKHSQTEIQLSQDKEMIRNIAINLISNALKYSDDSKSVIVMSRQIGNKLEFSIQDNGIGIPERDQKHLFERFFRAHNVINLQGTGLGLNIVKRYLDLIGGEITFTSQENIGTTFTVTLPLETPNEKNSHN